MGWDLNVGRRWFGAAVLAAALAMLVAGETVLENRLKGLSFLAYWLTCFGLTAAAAVVALLDARALRQRAREQRRDLLTSTLKDIQSQARTRSRSRHGKS